MRKTYLLTIFAISLSACGGSPDDPYAGFWDDYGGQCAAEEESSPPEQLGDGALPDELDSESTPEVVWRRDGFCGDGTDEESGDADQLSYNDIAYANLTVDGEKREVVVDIIQRDDSGDEMVAFLDPENGEDVECHDFPNQEMSASRSPVPVSQNDVLYLPYAHVPEVGRTSPPGLLGFLRYGSEQTRDLEERFTLDVPGTGRIDGLTLLPNGEFVMNVDEHRLVSIAAETGEITWTSEGPARFAAAPWRRGESEFVYPVRGEDEWSLRAHGACGEVRTQRLDGEQESDWTPLEGGFVVQDNDRLAVIGDDGSEMFAEPDCYGWATLDTDRIACMKASETTAQLVLYDLGVRERSTVELDAALPSGAETLNVSSSIIAGRDGEIVAGVEWEDSSGPRHYRVIIADTDDGTTKYLDLERPDEASDSTVESTPLLTPSGLLVHTAWGHLYGIQTTIPGLAEAPFPRGPSFGGNENRGAVQTP